MGVVLKTLLGIFLFVWTVIGVVWIAGVLLLASQVGKLSDQFEKMGSLFGQLGGQQSGQPFSGQSPMSQFGGPSQSPEIDQETQDCLKEELGESRMQELGQNQQPTEQDKQAMDRCRFQPPDGQSSPSSSFQGQNFGSSPSGQSSFTPSSPKK